MSTPPSSSSVRTSGSTRGWTRHSSPASRPTALGSIKADGLAEVITVYRNESRDLVVLKGQRRTTVAVGTPTGTVPVRVLPKPADPTASSSSWSRTSIAPT